MTEQAQAAQVPVLNVLADALHQPRPGQADAFLIRRIVATLMDGGEARDPVIVVRNPDGTLGLRDGFHRLAAYRQAQRPTIPAIVIEDAATAWEITAANNVQHGNAWGKATFIRHIVQGIGSGAFLTPMGRPRWSRAGLAREFAGPAGFGTDRAAVDACRKAISREASRMAKESPEIAEGLRVLDAHFSTTADTRSPLRPTPAELRHAKHLKHSSEIRQAAKELAKRANKLPPLYRSEALAPIDAVRRGDKPLPLDPLCP